MCSGPHQRKAHLFITLLSYLAIGCLSVAVYELGRFSVAYPDKTVHLLPGRNLVPYFPHNQVIQFEPNHVYAGNQSSEAWDDLNAEGGGWIAIEDGEKLGMVVRERDEFRREAELLRRENALLREQVEGLQKENTGLVAQMGRVRAATMEGGGIGDKVA